MRPGAGEGGSGSRPIFSTSDLEKQEKESDDLTDSEESIFSGLEDSGSDSITEEDEDYGSGVEEKSEGVLPSENMQVSVECEFRICGIASSCSFL
ncbi:ribosome biogenesis protein BOP1-like [Elgaria multicarinata webbii]|uniref:ribosome biogenesis protein BOP1-like n=1 Tax=Elgaria multicarinata webbii TaxID=159646 RepID=UPI002FCCE40D